MATPFVVDRDRTTIKIPKKFPARGLEPVETRNDTKKIEDEYFARIEFERRKKALTERQGAMKQTEREDLKSLHWMHCPKCGMEMVEIDFEGIKVDKCSACLGVFFDNGEVQHLVEKNKPGFLSRMTSLFKD